MNPKLVSRRFRWPRQTDTTQPPSRWRVAKDRELTIIPEALLREDRGPNELDPPRDEMVLDLRGW